MVEVWWSKDPQFGCKIAFVPVVLSPIVVEYEITVDPGIFQSGLKSIRVGIKVVNLSRINKHFNHDHATTPYFSRPPGPTQASLSSWTVQLFALSKGLSPQKCRIFVRIRQVR